MSGVEVAPALASGVLIYLREKGTERQSRVDSGDPASPQLLRGCREDVKFEIT